MSWRAVMALIGGLAGLCLWALYRVLDAQLLPERAGLALTAWACAFFIGLLAMSGPLQPARAAGRAAIVATAAMAFLVLASFRFADADSLIDSGYAPAAFFVMALIPLPFCIAGGWRDYPALFAQSWGIVTRYIAACLFTGLFWAVLLLSDALLGIVGIDWIGNVIDRPGAVMVLTGIAFGLAIAVADELSEVVTPNLILRLLRLFIPVVLVVLTVFIVALPLRGLSGLFGGLSAAGTLLGICIAIATLVTVAVDRTEGEAVHLPVMVLSAKALAVILPVPAALSLWSVVMRVQAYGWTPSRVSAVLAAGVALAYGVVYLAAVLRGRGWVGAIRRGNIHLAMLLVALAALWQTPLLNAQRIAAHDQAARIEAGRTPRPDLVPFDRWGLAGLRERERLAALNLPVEVPTLRALTDTLAVRPVSEIATRDRILAALSGDMRADWTGQCSNTLPDGRPACVMVVGPFLPDLGGDQALMISENESYATVNAVRLDGGRIIPLSVDQGWSVKLGDVAAILESDGQLVPQRRNQLLLGDRALTLTP